jgi:Tfp pilus assembly PilM family ATPase
LEFGDERVAVARVRRDRQGGWRVLNAGRIAVSHGSTPREVAKGIRRLWRELGIPTRTVNVSYRSPTSVIKTFRFPAMTNDELSSALRLEASELLDMPPDDVVFDWRQTRSSQPSNSPQTAGVLVALPRREVEDVRVLLSKSGLYPVLLNVPGLVIAMLMDRIVEDQDPHQVVGLVNLAGTYADIVVRSPGSIYPRTIHRDDGPWDADLTDLGDHVAESFRDAQ